MHACKRMYVRMTMCVYAYVCTYVCMYANYDGLAMLVSLRMAVGNGES